MAEGFDVGAAFMDILPRAEGFGPELRELLAPAFDAAEADATSAGKGIGTALTAGLVIAGTLATTAIGKAISVTQDWGSEVRSLQKVTGLAAEEASGLAATGDLLGISVDRLAASFGIFDKNLVNGAANLAKYGITTRDASGQLLPFDDLLANTSERFLELETAQEQAAFAQNVFGKGGRELIPLLKLGAAGLADYREEAERLGLVLSEDDVQATKELALAQREFDASIKGVGVSLGRIFIPLLTKGVEVLTSFIGLIQDVPQPVLAGVLALTALTGAVAAGLKIYGFFSSTWRDVLDAIDKGTATLEAGTAAVDSLNTAAGAGIGSAAFQAQTAAATELTTAVHTLSTGLGIELPAAETRALATQEILNRSWARGAVDLSTLNVAAGEGGATSGLSALGAVAAPLIGVLGGLALVIKLTGDAARSTDAEIDSIVKSVQSGVRTIPSLRAEITRLRAGEGTLVGGRFTEFTQNPSIKGPSFVTAGGVGKQVTDAKELEEAIARVREQQNLLEQTTSEVTAGIRAEFDSIVDFTQTFEQAGITTDRFNVLLGRTADGLDHLADISGVDASKVVADIQKVVSDPKASIQDVLDAYEQGIVGVKAAYQDWHDSLVENFGGAAGALEEFVGNNHVVFSHLTDDLDQQRHDLRDWQQDFDTILKTGGVAAKTFLNQMSENGLDSLGILDAVASQPRKIRNEFLANYNDVNKQTDSLASGIQKALDPAFKAIILQLKNVVRAIEGLPPIKLNADQAFGTLKQLREQLAALEGEHDINVQLHTAGSGGHVLAEGGVIRGESGFITQGPTFLVGEGSNRTAFGRGAEAVIPLDDSTLDKLAQRIAAQGGSAHPVGSDVGDLAREVGREVARAMRSTTLEVGPDSLGHLVDSLARLFDDHRRRDRMVTG